MSLALLLLLAPAAPALECLTPSMPPPPDRPTEGTGLYAFDPSDVVVFLESTSGGVRIHYSVSGPNVTILDDADADGVPDFPELVGDAVEGAFQAFQAFGFRPPVSETEMGLGDLGGSPAFDIYLVDFAGVGDGMFSTDACTTEPSHCSGYIVMENDFEGYGYPDLETAVTTLASHELFHAVQMAYESGSPVWYTEGTAVWAERLFDLYNEDFLRFADAYLEDTGRSLDQPPSGPVPTFAYATCLWWWFLTLKYGVGVNAAIQEGLEWDGAPKDTLTEMVLAIEAQGGGLAEDWSTFASWNLATRGRAGAMESYDFAVQIGPVEITAQGWPLEDDNRFYPLAASYFRFSHPGGPMWFAHEDDASGVVFVLHPVADGEPEGPVADAVARWTPTAEPERQRLSADLPAGGYFVVGSYAAVADTSRKVHFCIGDEAAVDACVPEGTDDTGDTGEDRLPDLDTGVDDSRNCGCASSGRGRGSGLALAGLLLALGTVRRRR